MDSEIGGVNTTVAQIEAQLDNANWELSQTTVRAPADGYVTVVALSVGDRALQARSAMSFIVENEIALVGPFSQNGFQTIKDGTPVDIVFENAPGRICHAKGIAIPKGIGQGQTAVSGTLARTNTFGGATLFPAVISIPEGMSRGSLRLGMSGSATALSDKAGVIGLLASILVWISAYTAICSGYREEGRCPLWVKRVVLTMLRSLPVFTYEQTSSDRGQLVRFVPTADIRRASLTPSRSFFPCDACRRFNRT